VFRCVSQEQYAAYRKIAGADKSLLKLAANMIIRLENYQKDIKNLITRPPPLEKVFR
jgi:hypothetical protein